MSKRARYSQEFRTRAVRMLIQHEGEFDSRTKAINSISKKLGCNHETLRSWAMKREFDSGRRPGITSEEQARVKELERENRELRRANEILRKASAYFAQAELGRPLK
jgi:transposase